MEDVPHQMGLLRFSRLNRGFILVCFIYMFFFIWTLQTIRTMRYPEKWGINHPSYLSEGETISSFDMMRMDLFFVGLYSFGIVSMFPKYMDWKPKITHRTPVWLTQPIQLQCFGDICFTTIQRFGINMVYPLTIRGHSRQPIWLVTRS